MKVLNAFRHHRNSHFFPLSVTYRSLVCSTPFGIIGIHTITSLAIVRVSGRAQRLSASSEFTPRARPVTVTVLTFCAQRLSASSEFTRCKNFSGLRPRFSAQRLSASSEFTPQIEARKDKLLQCSTPFGIIGIHTLLKLADSGRQLRCSTPFGIIGIHTA